MVDTKYGLVPYETANTANKIKIGVTIAKQLAEALEWDKIPMVIDNLEAITANNSAFNTDTQVIGLVADDLPAKKLYLEEPKQEQMFFEN